MIYLWLALSLLLLYLAYFFYFKPKKLCQHYVKLLRQRGYKVIQFPFMPFNCPLNINIEKDTIEKKDPLYSFKYEMQGYDVIVSNELYHPQLIFLNLKLGREITGADKLMVLQKSKFQLSILFRTFGKGLFFAERQEWKSRRKLITKVLNFDVLMGLVPHIADVCDLAYDRLEAQNKEKGNEEQLSGELYNMAISIFSSVLSTSFLGMDAFYEKLEDKPFNQYGMEVFNQSFCASPDSLTILSEKVLNKLGLKLTYRDLESKYQRLKTFAKGKLGEIRTDFETMSPEQQKNSKNLIHSLLYQAKDKSNAYAYSEEQLVHQLILFTFVGSDTSSSLFTTMLLEISNHPEIEKKLREEIKAVFKTKGDFTFQNIKKMQLIDLIQMQVLRLYPPANGILSRVANTDISIEDIPINAGTRLNYFQATSFYDNNVFQDAHAFRPERWASKDSKVQQLQNLVLLGFGGGPRACIGKNLALLQSKIALIKFMQRYENLKQVSEREFMFDLAYHVQNGEVTFTKVK